jgi:hypothetical protein
MPTQGSLRSPWAIQIKPLRVFLSSGAFGSLEIQIVPGFRFSGQRIVPGLFVLRGNAKTFRLAGSLSTILTEGDEGVSSNGKERQLGGSKATAQG